MISPEEVASSLADLAERSSVPLRVPVRKLAGQVLAARDAAPYDVPFVRG
jgi:molybdopterin biosynthesis enzyme